MSFLMFVGVAFPWLLVVNLIFVALWALSRLRYWWYSAAAILVGWAHLTSIFGIHYMRNTEGVDSTSSIRVMTYNIHMGITPNGKKTIANRLELSQFIEQKSPDVLCLQEFVLNLGSINDKQMMEDIPFLKTYPYSVRLEGNAIAIFSRFPIIESGILLNQKEQNGCTFADVSVNNQTIRFYSLQLHSNVVSDIADDLAKKKDLTDDDSWFEMGRMLTRFRRNGIIRSRDAVTIKKHIKESPYPVVLCGDFNDIPISYVYHTLSEDLTDAFQETGQGVGTTYGGHIPALRIDYILTDPRLKPLNCTIQRVRYSDHYPVVGDFEIK